MQLRPEEKTYAMWCHLSSLCALVGVPFGHVLGPLIVWQMKKNESAFVDENGKESLNFQLSFLLYFFAALLALFGSFIAFIALGARSTSSATPQTPGALLALLVGSGFIGPLLLLLSGPFLNILFSIIAAIQASSGQVFRYPFIIHFLR